VTRQAGTLSSIELFTGGGGLALGLEAAGFRHVLVNEIDRRACATLAANRAWPLAEGDVRGLDFASFEGKVDVVAGGVPCQPWSLGGAHRGYDDARNLWPELFRVVRETRPKAVIAENVKGLLRPSFRPYYDYILRELSAPFEERVDGEDWHDHDRRLRKALSAPESDASERYDVHYLLVNAADYGVPQVRWRVFVVAFRADLRVNWTWPGATHSEAAPIGARTHDGPQPWRTVRDAIGDLPAPPGDRVETPGYLHHVGWDGAREYPGHTPNDLDRPAKTVKAGVHGVPGGESVIRLDDGSIRYLTVREVARLMTFPDDWFLAGPRGEQMRQLGNAVPVKLAAIMARAVRAALKIS
jgi:DNA (cytosine-5)-methyltransferase 1